MFDGLISSGFGNGCGGVIPGLGLFVFVLLLLFAESARD